MGAKFVVASDSARELLVYELLWSWMSIAASIPMMVDNQDVIKHLEGEASPTKTKHIDIRVKFVCDQARRGIIITRYVPSDKMVAEVLMEVLDFPKLSNMRALVGLQWRQHEMLKNGDVVHAILMEVGDGRLSAAITSLNDRAVWHSARCLYADRIHRKYIG